MTIETENVVPIKKSKEDEVRAKIQLAASIATADDKKLSAEIIARAVKGDKDFGVYKITAAAAAMIFLDRNPHNRDWRGGKTEELARRMLAGEWEWNNASVGFYLDGDMSDGQHRLAATALAGYALHTGVGFGMKRGAIVTVDCGTHRTAADAAKLDGVNGAQKKQAIIMTFSSYMVKAGDKTAVLLSPVQIKDAIHRDNDMLERAIEIGDASTANVLNPTLKAAQAQSLAYLMLKSNWPETRVREKLALFQTGNPHDSGDNPFFVAGKVISSSRQARENRDRLSGMKEIGVAILAMVQTEQGMRVANPRTLKAAVNKVLPKPHYPADASVAA